MITRYYKTIIVVPFFAVTCWVFDSAATGQDAEKSVEVAKEKERSQRGEKLKIQYRTAGDAIAPSSFLLVSDRGPSLTPLTIKWDLPKLSGKKLDSQKKKKQAFDRLIKLLEKRLISVEFECQGAWAKAPGALGPDLLNNSLHLMSVPELTEESKARLR